MCKKMIFKHSSASSTLVTLPFYKWGGHRLLWNVPVPCCPLLCSPVRSKWSAHPQLLTTPAIFTAMTLVPHFLSLSKSCSNLTGVLIQEQQTQRGLLDSGSHSTSSPATKYLLQGLCPWSHMCQSSHLPLRVYKIYSIIYTTLTEKY